MIQNIPLMASSLFLVLATCFTPLAGAPKQEETLPEPAMKRVQAGLLVDYRFDEATGTKVHDHSGQLPALDLAIENASAVRWISGGLSIQSPTLLNSQGPALRLTEAIRQSGEITVEAWIRPANLSQDGTARLLGLSNGASMRNFTLGQGLWEGQPSDTFNMRFRTTETNLDGMPMLTTEAGAATGAIQQVIYTRATDGSTALFVDGKLAAQSRTAGDTSNWDSSYRLAVANEIGATRPWLGDIFRMAIYDRALSVEEIQQNHAVGSGASNLGHLAVEPLADITVLLIKGSGELRAERGWNIHNIGTRPLQWSLTEDVDWITFQPGTGSLAPGAQEPLELQLDKAKLEALEIGTYRVPIQFTNQDEGLGDCQRSVVLLVREPGTSEFGTKPGPHNTGPKDPTLLQDVGSMTITKAGSVIENVRIRGMLQIMANDVTVRNFVIDAQGEPYGLRCSFGNTGILLEDGEILNAASSCVYGGGFTAKRLNLHESGGDGFKTSSGSVVEACWVHHLGTMPGAHADCNQTREGQHFVFRGNFFDLPIDIGAPYKSNACLIVQTGLGPIDDVLIENNWLTGGNFTLYITDKGNGYGSPTNVRVLNNRFGREYRYGVLDNFGYVLLQGNRWDDTGELMPINNQ